jgi:hypothetical protein
MTGKREPWHYDAIEGRPEWSTQLARLNVIRRQEENLKRSRQRDEILRKIRERKLEHS